MVIYYYCFMFPVFALYQLKISAKSVGILQCEDQFSQILTLAVCAQCSPGVSCHAGRPFQISEILA